MPIELDAMEARILGALVEKSLTTPDQYPLSFNALLNACNQKSSRDPVMSLDTNELGRGVTALIEKGLMERRTGSRVPKFLHIVEKLVDTDRPQTIAAVTVLLLRGPQTPGEIKTRSERLFKFETTAEVEALLGDMAARPGGPFVARLARRPGQKESRYQQLFTGPVSDAAPASAPAPAAPAQAQDDTLARLEKRIEELESFRKSAVERLDKLEGREP